MIMRRDRLPSLRQSFAIAGGILFSVLALAVILFTPPARSAEPSAPTVKIDDSGSPIISIEARDIAVPDLLRELSNRLHFAIEGLSILDREEKVTVSSKGDLEDILRRIVLPGRGFVTFYREKMIDRIVIVGSNAAGSEAPALPKQAAAEKQSPGNPDAPPSAVKTNAPAPTTASAAAPVQLDLVNTLLQTQLNIQQQVGAGAGRGDSSGTASVPQPANAANLSGQESSASMAALTQTARQNVLMLSSALRAVCMGPNCAH
jgi:hypothetical protein